MKLAIFFILLWRDQNRRQMKSADAVANPTFDFLRKDYKEDFYYFECCSLLQKLLLTGVLIFARQGTVFQAYAGTTIACAFVAVQTRFWPYVDPMDNKLKFVAEAQLFTTLLISIVLRTDNHTDALTRDQYGTILAVSFFAAPAVVIGSLLRVCTKWVRSKREGQD